MSGERTKAVFFDRDGVINGTVFRKGAQRAPQDMSEFAYLDGVASTLAALRDRGYLLLVCTNQPDVARGWQTRDQVLEFHARIERELPVSGIYACFHDDAHDCECRKPKPGLIHQAGRHFNVDYAQSFMIGDRWTDIEAGRAAGCRTVYLRHAHDSEDAHAPDFEIRSIAELLAIIP
jgi:D-glycero-D-manno-heptose 1,7-bisphosphate phosphatase